MRVDRWMVPLSSSFPPLRPLLHVRTRGSGGDFLFGCAVTKPYSAYGIIAHSQ